MSSAPRAPPHPSSAPLPLAEASGPPWGRRRAPSTLRATCWSRACRVRPPVCTLEQSFQGCQSMHGICVVCVVVLWHLRRLCPASALVHGAAFATCRHHVAHPCPNPACCLACRSGQPVCVHPRLLLLQDAGGVPAQGARTPDRGRAVCQTSSNPNPPLSWLCCRESRRQRAWQQSVHTCRLRLLAMARTTCLPPCLQVLTYGIATAAILRMVLIVAGVDIGKAAGVWCTRPAVHAGWACLMHYAAHLHCTRAPCCTHRCSLLTHTSVPCTLLPSLCSGALRAGPAAVCRYPARLQHQAASVSAALDRTVDTPWQTPCRFANPVSCLCQMGPHCDVVYGLARCCPTAECRLLLLRCTSCLQVE